jgi:hypothetical protein
VIAVLGVERTLYYWIYSWTEIETAGCLHSCMHCSREAQGHGSLRAPHAVHSTVQSSVDEFRSQDFGLKLNWEAHPWDPDLVYSVLSPEWN